MNINGGDSLRADVAGFGTSLQPQVLTDEVEFQEQFLHTLHIKSSCVVAVIVFRAADGIIAFGEKLVVVKVTTVTWNAEVVAHVL